ncbi:hypothetical protein DFH09DRAFT_1365159 [Mycena vulgaris]|nr:hypothetical protein DFH09DRAFT_1365159 [Mycena vulgaris]
MLTHSSSRTICKNLCQASLAVPRGVSSPCLRRVVCRNLSTNDDNFAHRRRPSHPSDSIFSSEGSTTWDHVFSNIKKTPPQIPQTSGIGPRRPRRQTMTAQEITAFNEIFNMIFESMSEKGAGQPRSSVEVEGTGMGDLFSSLRRHSKRMKWTAQSDEELDRKKDEMDRCETDQQLLNWAMREVFGESQSYFEEFSLVKDENDAKVGEDANAELEELPPLQPPTYPHLIALLVRTFRDKYRDPHLALSMFDYARQLSTASYVFGCSTSAYNELITTRWTCFRDLRGVHDALEEMSVNGVDMDNKTRELTEKVREEVGARNLWMEENEIGTDGVWEMLNNIDRLVHEKVGSRARKLPTKNQKRSIGWSDWRAAEVTDTVTPDWEFNSW